MEAVEYLVEGYRIVIVALVNKNDDFVEVLFNHFPDILGKLDKECIMQLIDSNNSIAPKVIESKEITTFNNHELSMITIKNISLIEKLFTNKEVFNRLDGKALVRIIRGTEIGENIFSPIILTF